MTLVAAKDVSLRRLTVAEFDRMVEVGIIGPDERVELLDGAIVKMPPIGPEHATGVNRLGDYFNRRFGKRAHVRSQCPLELSDRSKPQPDITLVRLPWEPYTLRHPRPEEVLLLLEVADTSLLSDRRVKLPLYARHAIPEAWLLHLPKRSLTVHREPGRGGYRDVRTLTDEDASIAPLFAPDVPVFLRDLLLPQRRRRG